MKGLDQDGDGTLSFAEFLGGYANLGPEAQKNAANTLWEAVSRSLDDEQYLRVIDAFKIEFRHRNEAQHGIVLDFLMEKLRSAQIPKPVCEELAEAPLCSSAYAA